jgi:predicted DNA-binding transcriptional regulator AlpA
MTLTRATSDLEHALRTEQENLRDLLRQVQEASNTLRDPLWSVQEVADYLQTSTAWVYSRIRRKTDPLPAFDDGILRIRKTALDAWIDRNSQSETGLTLLSA